MLATLRKSLVDRLKVVGVYEALRPRACHAYGVGAPKTGTQSIARLFERRLRAVHEPVGAGTMEWIIAAHRGERAPDEVARYLRWRDLELYYEIESSHPLSVFTPALVELLPKARFILTVREPQSWLDSVINQHLNRPQDPDKPRQHFFQTLRDLYHDADGRTHTAAEAPLRDRGLYTLDGYLAYWGRHNRMVLDSVPQDRLLVLATEQISTSVERIADFIGVPREWAEEENSHSHEAPRRHGVLDELDPDLLRDKVHEHCADVVGRLAPYGIRWA